MATVPDLGVDDLHITVSTADAACVRLDWVGRSTDRAPERFLQPFLADVAERALRGSGVVEMHFEHLDYFNSATINAMIQFFRRARERQLRVDICFHAGMRWQCISFEALRVFERRDGMLRFRAVEG